MVEPVAGISRTNAQPLVAWSTSTPAGSAALPAGPTPDPAIPLLGDIDGGVAPAGKPKPTPEQLEQEYRAAAEGALDKIEEDGGYKNAKGILLKEHPDLDVRRAQRTQSGRDHQTLFIAGGVQCGQEGRS